MRLPLAILTTLAALALAGSASADSGAMQEVSTTRKADATAKPPVAAPQGFTLVKDFDKSSPALTHTAPVPGAPPPKAGFTATVSPQAGATPNAATKAPAKKEEAKKE